MINSKQELLDITKGRQILIWGMGHTARTVQKTLSNWGLESTIFVKHFWVFDDVFIITGSVTFREIMVDFCKSHGKKFGEDFVTHLSIPRPEAYIYPGPDYKKVLKKLLEEMPELVGIIVPDERYVEYTSYFLPCRNGMQDNSYPSYGVMLSDLERGIYPKWKYQKVFDVLQKEKDKPCLCSRIWPVINCNNSVSICHLYPNTIICDDFLSTPMNEIKRSDFCERCKAHGLHRLDIEVLRKTYKEEELI